MTSDRKNVGYPLLAFVVVITLGCATAYTPRPSHRISFTESGGAFKLTRDSQSFGMWDVDRAVASNPQAESEARTYVHRTIPGLILDLAGVGLVVGGVELADWSASSTRREVGASMVVGGVVSVAAALALLLTGLPHFYDAVNIYNDGLPPETNH